MLIEELKQSDPTFQSDITRIVQGEHWDPHHVLGIHPFFEGKKAIRLWRPGAKEVFVELFGEVHPARRIHAAGLFDLVVPDNTSPTDYRVYHQNGLLAQDPYAFSPTWGEIDAHLFGGGTHYRLFDVLGARETVHLGVKGVKFNVWAPSALRVSVVGDFNFWDGRVNPMRSMGQSGVWELFIPGIEEGERYKFEIKSRSGQLLVKADPFALAAELRPLTASVVGRVDRYEWNDSAWMERRVREAGKPRPMNVYEVHLGSWKLKHGHYLNYQELAHELAAYCNEMGFTHVELMPVAEHPLDESWGYQVVGFFAVTSRFGTPADFQYFVDHMHQQGIGVLLDWVPGHFPTDAFALSRFDGTALYEHEDPRQGYHPHWNTSIFNYGRREVTNFLISSALFWIEVMHIDGLRVDAVASMLYLDYGREEGGWIPNPYGGRENIEAIEFLKHLNSIVHRKHPGTLMIAEESTAFAGVTRPVDWDGLGFDLKWNLGWMNDTLRYFHKDPIFRKYHHNDLTFGLLYAFTENFMLVLSHDEVVHGKGSLLSKMPGDYWQQFANMRLLYSYMLCQPGKNLLFMGGELGQWNEWNSKEEIHWHLLQYPIHHGVQKLVRAMNHFALDHPPLWQRDFDYTGFEWVDLSDTDNSVISYRRKADVPYELVCIHNFTPAYHHEYALALQGVKRVKEVFNSDALDFGGSGKCGLPIQNDGDHITLSLPPLATIILEIHF